MPIPIQNIINEAIREPREHRKITSWHISKLGQCLRGIYFERLGVEPDSDFDDRTLRVFSVGKLMENWLIDQIKNSPDIKFETQVRVEDLKLNVSGYVDLVVEYLGEKQIYEIKSKHSQAFWWMRNNGNGAPRHNQYQLWMYLYLLKIEKGNLIYLSKDDLSILEYPVLLNDKKLKEEVFNELKLLNKAWQEKNPAILPLPDKKDWQAKYCRYHSKCVAV